MCWVLVLEYLGYEYYNYMSLSWLPYQVGFFHIFYISTTAEPAVGKRVRQTRRAHSRAVNASSREQTLKYQNDNTSFFIFRLISRTSQPVVNGSHNTDCEAERTIRPMFLLTLLVEVRTPNHSTLVLLLRTWYALALHIVLYRFLYECIRHALFFQEVCRSEKIWERTESCAMNYR